MQPHLLLHDVEALHWGIAGAALGLITLAMLYLVNHRLGASTGFESLCALVSKRPYFRRPELQGRGRWRLAFFVGLLGGGILSSVLAGTWQPSWDMGIFDTVIGWGPIGKVAWMFAGGLLVGFGTRTAGGCTSGHGVFGIANLERSGIVSTLSFMAAGLVTTHLIYRVFGAG